MKEYMSIGQFASEIGVSESTLRNWDRQGKLRPHHLTKGGQRVYSAEQAREFLGQEDVVPEARSDADKTIMEPDSIVESVFVEGSDGNDRIVKIQGRKGRDVYYFNYADNSVTDKIGNRVILQENIDGVQDIVLQDYLDDLFHKMYHTANSVSEGFVTMRKMRDIQWIRMT
ncbi:MAG: MerR family transcriptional regulator [Lachnospiraceae bacterium]|nr:MerR family transcriptional regulator [Lachnospiraceae bacterium]MBQ8947850.1 MerR family transcriptional regulator [Lachnospiraceae bacterium]